MRGSRILKAGVVLCGLAGAVYAAEEVGNPTPPTLEQTIAEQLSAEGRQAQEQGLTKEVEHLTPDQMLGMAVQYDKEMRQSIDHAGDVKIIAYRSHDIIRMTCIDDKIEQMKQVILVTEPRYLMLRTFKTQPIVMQSQFAIINIARARVHDLNQEVDACLGDNLDAVTVGRIQEENVYHTVDNLNDPTKPQTSFEEIDRPPEASPYR